MTGPYYFGTTATLNGIWTIFYRLHIIMKWGVTEYKDWFKAHIMQWARLRAEGGGTGVGSVVAASTE